MSDVIFLIGSARSGTTALAKILSTATNAEIHVEQPPRLRVASRELYKGTLADPEDALRKAKAEAICGAREKGKKYGDKNPCYLPFIPYLAEVWDAKMLYMVRDGRDVVRSLMDWHEMKAKNIYGMREDGVVDGPAEPEDDPWDYSRLRPNPGEPYYGEWAALSRFEKCAWYWARFNEVALELLGRQPRGRWMQINVSERSADDIERVFRFLELDGFDGVKVAAMLATDINSVKDRTGQENRFPRWRQWDAAQTASFDRFAAPMMERLGYYRK